MYERLYYAALIANTNKDSLLALSGSLTLTRAHFTMTKQGVDM